MAGSKVAVNAAAAAVGRSDGEEASTATVGTAVAADAGVDVGAVVEGAAVHAATMEAISAAVAEARTNRITTDMSTLSKICWRFGGALGSTPG